MRPIPFRERLVVRLALGMIGVALLSLLLTFILQFLSVTLLADIQPPRLESKLREIIAENPNDPEFIDLIETPIRMRNIVFRTGVFSLLISGALWVYFAIRFSRSIAEPIERVTLASAQITSGDLATRVQMPNKVKGEPAQLLEHFNKMASSLESYERERMEMIASIAHELRTPLAVTRSRLELIEEGIVEANTTEVKKLSRQIDLLARLVDDLRTLSLADANRLSLQKELTDLKELVVRVLDAFKLQLAEKKLDLKEDLESVAATVDPQRIEQVVINLLDNAVKHTPENGAIEISLKKRDTHVQLDIRDTGKGFNVESQKLFQRFYTSDKEGGTGLGLSLVAALVNLHGGQVSASNHPKGGAIFTVRVPLA